MHTRRARSFLARRPCFDDPSRVARWRRDDTPFAFARQVATLRVFVDQLRLERYALLGHDTGGTLARLLALDDRTRAGRVIVMNSEMPGHRPPWIPLYQRLAALPFTAS